MNAHPLLLLPRALAHMPGPVARRFSHAFAVTPSRSFADLPAPPRAITYATWSRAGMDVPTATFLSALERSRAADGRFTVTLADVNAASQVLAIEARGNDRLQRSTTYDGLRVDVIDLARMPADDPQRQARLDQLFQQLLDLMASHAPTLLLPRHFWSTVTGCDAQAAPARTDSEPLASFQLTSGQSLSLAWLAPEDPQALTGFFEGLSTASFQARFPRQACSREQLATQVVLDAQHPMPERRHATLVLREEAQRIVGMLDYHQRPESMMRHAVSAAQAAGQPLPRPGLKTCEFNVVIADGLQGQGLGQRLLAFGMAHARQASHQQLVAVVAAANQPMRRCLERMGASAGVPLPDSGYLLHVLDPQAAMA